jgi:hypothetical protein
MGRRSDLTCVRKLRSGGASQGAPIGPGHHRERRWCGPLAWDEGLWHGTHVWLAEASLLYSNSLRWWQQPCASVWSSWLVPYMGPGRRLGPPRGLTIAT